MEYELANGSSGSGGGGEEREEEKAAAAAALEVCEKSPTDRFRRKRPSIAFTLRTIVVVVVAATA